MKTLAKLYEESKAKAIVEDSKDNGSSDNWLDRDLGEEDTKTKQSSTVK